MSVYSDSDKAADVGKSGDQFESRSNVIGALMYSRSGSGAGGYPSAGRGGGRVIGGRREHDDDDRPAADWTPPRPRGLSKREGPVIAAGDTVVHQRWGEGVVLTVSGAGDGAEATISFSEIGEKRVLLAYAPLTKAW